MEENQSSRQKKAELLAIVGNMSSFFVLICLAIPTNPSLAILCFVNILILGTIAFYLERKV